MNPDSGERTFGIFTPKRSNSVSCSRVRICRREK